MDSVIAPEQIKIKFDMVRVDGGYFTLRTQNDKRPHRFLSTYVHQFHIGKYPVTVELWNSVMGEPVNSAVRNIGLPVTRVNFYDAVEFCNKLSVLTGLRPCYTGIQNKRITWNKKSNGFRLPTVYEWIYAATGGNRTKGYIYSGSNTPFEVGWYYENSRNVPHPVGRLKPNELGIYDMSGNVEEWCWDYRSSEKKDLHKEKRVFRERAICGGSYEGSAQSMAIREYHYFYALYKYSNIGLRVVRTK